MNVVYFDQYIARAVNLVVYVEWVLMCVFLEMLGVLYIVLHLVKASVKETPLSSMV